MQQSMTCLTAFNWLLSTAFNGLLSTISLPWKESWKILNASWMARNFPSLVSSLPIGPQKATRTLFLASHNTPPIPARDMDPLAVPSTLNLTAAIGGGHQSSTFSSWRSPTGNTFKKRQIPFKINNISIVVYSTCFTVLSTKTPFFFLIIYSISCSSFLIWIILYLVILVFSSTLKRRFFFFGCC